MFLLDEAIASFPTSVVEEALGIVNGGTGPMRLALVKCLAISYGLICLTAAGLAGWVCRLLWGPADTAQT